MWRFPRSQRSIVVLVVSVHLVGCFSWHATPVTPVLQAQKPDRIRVTTVDGERIKFERWAVRGDSLVGAVGRAGVSTGLAVADVRSIETQQFAFLNTLGLILLVFVVGGAASY